MSTVNVEGGARWGGRALAIAGVMLTMLVGLAHAAWAASIQVAPTSGPAGKQVTVGGSGFTGIPYHCPIYISFTDANGTYTALDTLFGSTSFNVKEVIPADAATGEGTVRAAQNSYDPGTHRCKYPHYSATAPFTVTSGSGTQLLGNPGFENGSSSPAPWVTTAKINDTSAEPPHSGSWDAWLAGTGTTHTDSLYQDVAVPAGSTPVTLTFWLHVDTADGGSIPHDLMKVQVRSSSNAVLATLASYTNLDAGPGYVQKSFDLTSYAGQNIRVFVVGKEDASLQTSFVVDDFALTTP